MTHEDTAETVVDCSVDLKNFRRHPRKEVNPPAQTTMLSRKNIQGRGRRPGGVGFVPFSRICDGNPRVAIKNEGDRGARIALGSFRSKEGERSDPIEFVPPDGFGTVRDAEGLRRKSFPIKGIKPRLGSFRREARQAKFGGTVAIGFVWGNRVWAGPKARSVGIGEGGG